VKEWSEVLTFSYRAHCTTGGLKTTSTANERGSDDSEGVWNDG
jgi:hypothetical protein